MTLETLPDSTLPAELIELGYDVVPADPPEGRRIIAGTITEKFVRRADGELEPLVEGSTKPLAEIRRHASTCRVMRFTFAL